MARFIPDHTIKDVVNFSIFLFSWQVLVCATIYNLPFLIFKISRLTTTGDRKPVSSHSLSVSKFKRTQLIT